MYRVSLHVSSFLREREKMLVNEKDHSRLPWHDCKFHKDKFYRADVQISFSKF